jgi:hypothetical protein
MSGKSKRGPRPKPAAAPRRVFKPDPARGGYSWQVGKPVQEAPRTLTPAEKVTSKLRERLKEHRDELQKWRLGQIQKMGGPAAVHKILADLKSDDPKVRAATRAELRKPFTPRPMREIREDEDDASEPTDT